LDRARPAGNTHQRYSGGGCYHAHGECHNTEWEYVADRCRELGRALIKLELTATLPAAVDAAFEKEDEST